MTHAAKKKIENLLQVHKTFICEQPERSKSN